jgi:hypothetical protein
MMKKIIPMCGLVISLQSFAAIDCMLDGKSSEVLDPITAKPIENILKMVKRSSCNEELVFSDIWNPKYLVNHNKLRCSHIELCTSDENHLEADKDAKEIMKELLPKAVLLTEIEKEIQNKEKKQFNIDLYKFEKANNQKVCPEEKIEASCETSIRNAFKSVSGSLISFPNLTIAPTSDESLDAYFSNNFFNEDDKIVKSKKKGADLKKSAKDFKNSCNKKISFKTICENQISRLNSKDKLNLSKDQNSLASLLNSHKDKQDVFLAMEKELCSDDYKIDDMRVVGMVMHPLNRFNGANAIENMDSTNSYPLQNSGTENTKVESNQPDTFMGPPDLTEKYNSPDSSGALGHTKAEIPLNNNETIIATQSADPQTIAPQTIVQNEEDSSNIKNDESNLSETVTNSVNDTVESNSNKNAVNIAPNSIPSTNSTFNSDFANHIEEMNKENEFKNQLVDQNSDQSKVDRSISRAESAADKKKKDETSALMSQIEGLKSKIAEMNKGVEDLKAKKDNDNVDKDKIEKDRLEKEKAITDLKNKLAELEQEKKKTQLVAQLKAQQDESDRINNENLRQANLRNTQAFNNRYENEKFAATKNEREKTMNSNNQTSNSLGSESRSMSAGAFQGSAGPLLSVANTAANTSGDNSVVYMTTSEVQKYPYRLNNNATISEIENMILGNNGKPVLIGEDEIIIPDTVRDASNHVKYKKVKISLVKNDKEKKINVSRAISSVADLKKQDLEKQRDLIRYQEMKKAMQKAAIDKVQ